MSIRLALDTKKSLDRLPQPNSEFARKAIEEKLIGATKNKSKLQKRKKVLKKRRKRIQNNYHDEIKEIDTKLNTVKKKLNEIEEKEENQKKRKTEEKKKLKKALKQNTYQHLSKKNYVPKNAFEFDMNQSNILKKLEEETWTHLLAEIHEERTGEKLEKIRIADEDGSESFSLEVPDDPNLNSLSKI